MNNVLTRFSWFAGLSFLLAPAATFADVVPMMASSNVDIAISVGYYLSMLGFLIAAVVTFFAVQKFGSSTLGSIFTYLLIGTTTFFVITVFQSLGGNFFEISNESMDVWWHVMFYLAFVFYFFGLKQLIGLGSTESGQSAMVGIEKLWGLVALAILAAIFIVPKWLEPFIVQYDISALYSMGVHHFIAFALAGIVGYYLIAAKRNLGQIGRAIANPMIISIWALALQHLWELLNESWKVIAVTDSTGEGVEKIFLVVAAVGITYAAWRLKAFAQK